MSGAENNPRVVVTAAGVAMETEVMMVETEKLSPVLSDVMCDPTGTSQ